jgi:lysyl-tRNA synthetase, class II
MALTSVLIQRWRRAPWLPPLCAAGAAIVGIINVASTLTPNIGWRGHLLLALEPVEAIPVFHALTLPAGVSLLLAAIYLGRRRHRAWSAALVLLVVLGALNLLKGLDVEEAALSWGLALALWWGRAAFNVRHDPVTLRSAIWRVPALALVAVSAAALTTWASQGRPSTGTVARETGDLLVWQSGPLHFHGAFGWMPLGVGLVSLGALLIGAYLVFRPLAAPRSMPDPAARRLAGRLVRAHGHDTLSFFKLRADKQYFFAADGRAFVGYRIENGVMLLSGDPVGPADEVASLVREICGFAEMRGLRVGAVGASEAMAAHWEQAGLRSIYLGDEAIVDLNAFSLEGRPIRKVRQSVTRLAKAGYEAELHRVGDLDPALLAAAEDVLERGREGAPERGFAMAMDSLRGEELAESLVVLARDPEGAVRGVLHFVPCFGRAAASLSFMRRDPQTPNGLTEFLVVRAIELLRERDVEEISLNFAAFARWIHSPARLHEHVLGRVIALANPFFQIESLYRFNAKFFPRWEPRYLIFESALGLPRVGLAAMWAEGQLPKPRWRPADVADARSA